MASSISECKCPKCGYERGMRDYYYKIGNEYFTCHQCGYSSVVTCDEEKSVFPDGLVWNRIEEGGIGSYKYKEKSHPASAIGPVVDDTVEELENNGSSKESVGGFM